MWSISGVSTGERLPTTVSANSTSKPLSPTTSRMRLSACSSPSSGGTRQSTFRSARAGITLIFSEALIIVGVRVTPSIGSIRTATRGSVCLDLLERLLQVVGAQAQRLDQALRLR